MAEDLKSFTLEEIQSIAVDLTKSAQRLYELLENLLQWASMQRGTLIFQPEIIQLQSAANAIIKLFSEVCAGKNIEVIDDIPDSLKVYTDTNMLQTIFRNIISNAIKFSFRGSKIIISAKLLANGFLEIKIQDFGMGMSQSLKDNLFRIDARTNRPGTDGEPSSGLGLILCKEFIEKMGGELWVESEEKKGSTFYFTIPENH
jgi:signal transduction histidine kinase